MKKPIFIDSKEAINALPKRDIIHCFAGGIGADWGIEDVIKELNGAKRIAWIDDIFKHNLAIEAGEKSTWFNRTVLRFDVIAPKETL